MSAEAAGAIATMALGFITFHVAAHQWESAKGPRITAALMGFIGLVELGVGVWLALGTVIQ